MKKLLAVLTLGVFGMVAVAAWAAIEETSAEFDVERGRYIARASNCIACHSHDKGPYSGGTPFGIAYSPNITPDKETGIGNYSFEDFERAVRQGISTNSYFLSVMMPPSYAAMTDEDVRNLYAFFMKGVPPVSNAVKKIDSDRSAIGPRDIRPFAPGAGEDAVVARGRYLAEGLGHCGFCHTSRNEKGEEKALWSSQGKDYLAGGGNYAGWIAINLRGDHQDGLARRSEEELTEFFLTGRNNATAAFGKMIDIIENSTQYLTRDDAAAMARFIKSLPAGDPAKTPFKEDSTVAGQLWRGDTSKTGAAVYVDSCAACHKTNGSGYARFFPELRGNPVMMSRDPVSLIHITLMGQTLPGLKAAPSSITMPPFGWRLTDQQIADVVTFIRSSWGNNAPAVTHEDVRKVREDKSLFPDPRIFGNSNVDKLLDKQY